MRTNVLVMSFRELKLINYYGGWRGEVGVHRLWSLRCLPKRMSYLIKTWSKVSSSVLAGAFSGFALSSLGTGETGSLNSCNEDATIFIFLRLVKG